MGVIGLGNIGRFILILSIFSLGWLLNTVLTNFIYYDAEKPLSFGFSPLFSSPERASPSDHIKASQIHVFDNKVVIDAPGAKWAEFTDTNSMDPFLDETSNSIEISPGSPADIGVGDIISYRSGLANNLIVHRVVSRGVDEDGVFYLVKGDNNPRQDPEKVRFSQVHGILIGIIY